MGKRGNNVIKRYLEKDNWRIKENANMAYSHSQLQSLIAGKSIANWQLKNIFTPEIAKAHKEGYIYLHDLSGLLPYCAGWASDLVLAKGFPPYAVNSPISSKPKHFGSALGQLVNFIGVISNEWAGAQALSDFDTILAPFAFKDFLDYKTIRQNIQEFIYSVNITSRFPLQSPFLNIFLNFEVPKYLADVPTIPFPNKTYSQIPQQYYDMVNKAVLEVLTEGDANKRPFTFPIVTINLTKKFFTEISNAMKHIISRWICETGGGYFSNFVASNINPEDSRSMCCHLKLDIKQLKKQHSQAGLFGVNPQTGSLAVVDINLLKIGNSYNSVYSYVKLACDALLLKRKFLLNLFEKGFYHYSKEYLRNFDNHYMTLSVCGGWELYDSLVQKFSLKKNDFVKFAKTTLQQIRCYLRDYQERTGFLFNLEAAPIEGASYKLGKLSGVDYITSGFNLPPDFSDDPFEYWDYYDEIAPEFDGGFCYHWWVGENLTEDAAWTAIRSICYKSKIPYFTLTPTFSYCPACKKMLKGEHIKCPRCKNECDIYSRVVGYYRPVKSWNKGKQIEYKKRSRIKLLDNYDKEEIGVHGLSYKI
jgi:ribonucleoside-triphosphate reductase